MFNGSGAVYHLKLKSIRQISWHQCECTLGKCVVSMSTQGNFLSHNTVISAAETPQNSCNVWLTVYTRRLSCKDDCKRSREKKPNVSFYFIGCIKKEVNDKPERAGRGTHNSAFFFINANVTASDKNLFTPAQCYAVNVFKRRIVTQHLHAMKAQVDLDRKTGV